MFNIEFGDNGEILCSGRLDAAQCAKAEEFLGSVEGAEHTRFCPIGIHLQCRARYTVENAETPRC